MDEAAARVRLGSYRKMDAMAELEERSSKLLEGVEQALRDQDFEQAARLQKERTEVFVLWDKARRKARRGTGKKALSVGENEIAQIVSDWTKIPVSKLAESETQRLKKLESILHKRVIAQEEAVAAVSRAVRTGGPAGSRPPHRFFSLSGSNRRGKDRAFQGFG